MNSRRFPVIGIIGGIGSGKSTVAREWAARRNLAVIDADAIGHEVLKQPSVKQKIQARFGEEVFDADGEIQRSRLAARVFGADAESLKARNDLNRIVHPAIGEKIHEEIEKAKAQARREPGSREGVLLDAAILLETGWAEMCDWVVFVDASDAVREERIKNKGWNVSDWKSREQSQLDLDGKRTAADVAINNSQDLDHAVLELEKFFANRFLQSKPS